MLFIARFTNKPDSGKLWESLYPAHLNWLEEHRDAVLVPGSLRSDVNGAPMGGLWIVEADSKAAVETLYSTDPFWTNGLRQSVEVFHWKKAFEDRKVPI